MPERRIESFYLCEESECVVRMPTCESIFSALLVLKRRGFCKKGDVKNTSARNRYENR